MDRGLRRRAATPAATLTHTRRVPGAAGRPFVLVHGIGASSTYFEPLAQELREHGDVYLLDLPGFGTLPRPAEPMSIAGFAEAVRRCLEREDIRAPLLVGHSMGAQIVVELLAKHPATTDAAVLVGPVVNPAEATVARQAFRLAQSNWSESWRVRAVVVRAYLSSGLRWYAEVLPSMMRYPMRERLPEVPAQVLVVRGTRDTVVPRAWAEEVARLLPHGRVGEVPGAGHGVLFDEATPLAELILAHALS